MICMLMWICFIFLVVWSASWIWIIGLCLLPNFKSFQPYFFEYLFSSTLFLSRLIPDLKKKKKTHNYYIFFYRPTGPLSLFSLCYLDKSISFVLLSSSLFFPCLPFTFELLVQFYCYCVFQFWNLHLAHLPIGYFSAETFFFKSSYFFLNLFLVFSL